MQISQRYKLPAVLLVALSLVTAGVSPAIATGVSGASGYGTVTIDNDHYQPGQRITISGSGLITDASSDPSAYGGRPVLAVKVNFGDFPTSWTHGGDDAVLHYDESLMEEFAAFKVQPDGAVNGWIDLPATMTNGSYTLNFLGGSYNVSDSGEVRTDGLKLVAGSISLTFALGGGTEPAPPTPTAPTTPTTPTPTAPTPVALAALGLPTISGTHRVGNSLNAVLPTYNYSTGISFGYRWLRNGSVISGATQSSYTLNAADRGKRISARVVAHHTTGSVTSTSAQTSVIARGKITYSKKPAITGSATSGKTLKYRKATWNVSGVKVRYQWTRNGKKIKGATSSSYKLKRADRGKTIRLVVTAKKNGYSNLKVTTAAKKVAK